MPGDRLGAAEFARQYAALRQDEGWVGPDGREDPRTGKPELWRARIKLVAEAAEVLERESRGRGNKSLVVDAGSGGGWVAEHLPFARVVAIDLLPPAAVRADMRRLPLADASVAAMLYAASLHYAPLDEAIPEAARVLRDHGLLIAIDSPVYADEAGRRRAAARSAAYYRERGYPDLAAHYHPIEAGAMRAAITSEGFVIERFDVTRRRIGWWGGGSPACFVIARRLR